MSYLSCVYPQSTDGSSGQELELKGVLGGTQGIDSLRGTRAGLLHRLFQNAQSGPASSHGICDHTLSVPWTLPVLITDSSELPDCLRSLKRCGSETLKAGCHHPKRPGQTEPFSSEFWLGLRLA